uniref:Ectonucleotide pyrophosphatase/phosphodiesterase family member 6like [Oryzias latipes] n=1 Tax=Lepeophtheirus salmonis TaxID=72036 RepID=A0A0K2TR93_LEPSM
MMMTNGALASLLLYLLSPCVPLSRAMTSDTPDGYRNRLLVVVVDGFRWDYLRKFSLRSGKGFPGFEEFKRGGVHTKYLKSVFPAESFPAWQTINTGCYPQNHSIIGNQFADSLLMSSNQYSRHSTSLLFNSEDERTTNYLKWWEKAKPFWATATDQGLKIATFLWGRCDIPWNDVQTTSPDYCESIYQKDDSMTFNINLEKALIYFQRGYDAAFVYEGSLGESAEEYGPLSTKVEETLRELDNSLKIFLNRFKRINMEDKVNIIIMADHGMAYGSNPIAMNHPQNFPLQSIDVVKVSLGEKLGNVRHKVRMLVGSGAYSMIYPKKFRYTGEIVSILRRNLHGVARVYRHNEIPEHLHWKESPQTPPILVLAHPGTIILRSQGHLQWPRNKHTGYSTFDPSRIYEQTRQGMAGYDPEEPDMRGVFMAKGPDFVVDPNETYNAIELVDLYQMFCFLLGVEPQPNDGLWSRIRDLLKNSANGDFHPHFGLLLVSLLLVELTQML